MSLSAVLEFHETWFYVAVGSCGVVGLWGVILAVAKREPNRAFAWARGAAIGAMLLQVLAGVYLYTQDVRPGNSFHVFYGVVIVVTFTLAYLYRSTMAQRPALTYGLLLLFVMGLGLRAWVELA